MDRSMIILIAFALATIVMLLKSLVESQIYARRFKRMVKRISDVRKRIEMGENIPSLIIDMDKEGDRIELQPDGVSWKVDGKLYNIKNSCFMQKDNAIHIVGSKEDFIITLVGEKFH